MTTDGLQALGAMREKARSARHVPPPRHQPPKKKSAPAPAETAAPTKEAAEAAAPVSPPDRSMGEKPTELTRSTVYVTEEQDNWLEDIGITGRRSRPRIDANRSAIIRLALDRLQAELSQEAVLEHLRLRAQAAGTTPGRKRL